LGCTIGTQARKHGSFHDGFMYNLSFVVSTSWVFTYTSPLVMVR
jgi:hypothetical protein